MSVTVVGSVGLDTVETPAGRSEEQLGGAAVYFSLAAAHFTEVHLVGVVGSDFPQKHTDLLAGKGVGLAGLEVTEGRTFRWTGQYHEDVNERDTLDTQLNVFEHFHPKLPEAARAAEYLFLANIHPSLQLEVLEQTRHKLAGLDTMNLWMDIALDGLKEVVRKVEVFVINDAEAKQLTGKLNLREAAADIREMGPRLVVIKKGEHGCMLFGEENELFVAPAYPLERVVDPTGAGDSFAGAFMGYLAREQKQDFASVKRAVVYGSAMASFTCEAFGPDKLAEIDARDVEERFEAFRVLGSF